MMRLKQLQWRLTLTYTAVTVAALLLLEILIFVAFFVLGNVTGIWLDNYVRDVTYWLGPETFQYMEDGRDSAELQQWVDEIYANGKASFEPQGPFDSPAALIAEGYPITVLSMNGEELAYSAATPRPYPDDLTEADIYAIVAAKEQAKLGSLDPYKQYVKLSNGTLFVATPIVSRYDHDLPPAGILTLFVEFPSRLPRSTLISAAAIVLITGISSLMGIAPFGAFFGYLMARPMTRRLHTLHSAAEAWSRGDFSERPPITSEDEIGQLTRTMSEMADQIEYLMESRQQLATVEERNRLARELHDTVKQQNFATLMQLRAAKILATAARDPNVALGHLESAEELIKQSQQDLTSLITELRPAQLDGRGLAETIRAEATAWSERTGIETSVAIQGERSLPLETEQALFRVMQEALSNVVRHSEAKHVALTLAYEREWATLTIADDGRGFDATGESAKGFGLSTMRQRIAERGGMLTIDSQVDGGTTIAAKISL